MNALRTDDRVDRLIESARALGLSLDTQQVDRLFAYLELLSRWNRTYNLTSVRDPDTMVVQHLADCLAIVPSIRQRCEPETGAVADVGSGGGLPAVVLAILEPRRPIVAIDAVGKKAAFVRQVGVELGLGRLASIHGRVEDVTGQTFGLVVSRAFASLGTFATLTRHLLGDDGAWAAMKGKLPTDEIGGLPPDVEMFHVEHLRVPGLDAERCLVWMRPRVSGAASSR